MAGPRCTVVFPPAARRAAERIVETFERRQLMAARWLGIEPAGRPRIYLVDDYDGMRERGGAGVPEWAIAICRRDDVMVFRLDRVDRTPATRLDLVLIHETVHQVLGRLGGLPLPRWFEEGLCVYRTGVAYFEPDTTIGRLAAGGNLPPLAEADAWLRTDARRAAYLYQVGHSVVARFMTRFGDGRLRDLLRRVGEGAPFASAFFLATGHSLEEFEREWRASVTPRVPFLVWLVLENIELSLLAAGALLVVFAYVRYRIRRPRELERLDAGEAR